MGDNDPPRTEVLAQLGPTLVLPILAARQRRPRGEGNWAKEMEGFQFSLSQLFRSRRGLSGRGCDPGKAQGGCSLL